MMDENKIKNLKVYTYHRPRKPLRATSTSDRANGRLYLGESVDFEI